MSTMDEKANSPLGFLRQNLRYCPQECKKRVYILVLWSPKTHDENMSSRIRLSNSLFTRDTHRITN